MPGDKLRYALVGEGDEASFFLEAAEASGNCVVTALVSDDQRRSDQLARRFGIHLTKTVGEFARVLQLEAVDAVCLVSPDHARDVLSRGLPLVYVAATASGQAAGASVRAMAGEAPLLVLGADRMSVRLLQEYSARMLAIRAGASAAGSDRVSPDLKTAAAGADRPLFQEGRDG